jgi:hypothetical protein
MAIVAHVLEVRGLDIKKGLVTHKHLDKELVSLQEKMNDRIRLTQTLQGEHEKMTRVI